MADFQWASEPIPIEPGQQQTYSLTTCTGSSCGDALGNFLNAGPLKGTGQTLPKGGIGPGELASVGKNLGAPVYNKTDLNAENITPGMVMHLTRQPGDKNYQYGSTHIGIVDTDDENGLVFRSFTAGKGWRAQPINQKFIDNLPSKVTATVVPDFEARASKIAATIPNTGGSIQWAGEPEPIQNQTEIKWAGEPEPIKTAPPPPAATAQTQPGMVQGDNTPAVPLPTGPMPPRPIGGANRLWDLERQIRATGELPPERQVTEPPPAAELTIGEPRKRGGPVTQPGVPTPPDATSDTLAQFVSGPSGLPQGAGEIGGAAKDLVKSAFGKPRSVIGLESEYQERMKAVGIDAHPGWSKPLEMIGTQLWGGAKQGAAGMVDLWEKLTTPIKAFDKVNNSLKRARAQSLEICPQTSNEKQVNTTNSDISFLFPYTSRRISANIFYVHAGRSKKPNDL